MNIIGTQETTVNTHYYYYYSKKKPYAISFLNNLYTYKGLTVYNNNNKVYYLNNIIHYWYMSTLSIAHIWSAMMIAPTWPMRL